MKSILTILFLSVAFIFSGTTMQGENTLVESELQVAGMDTTENMKYDITTKTKQFDTAPENEDSDIYIFDDESSYYISIRNNTLLGNLVREYGVYNGYSYSRFYRLASSYGDEVAPFTKSTNPAIQERIKSFFNHPVFGLSIDASGTSQEFTIVFSSLSEAEKEYIRNDIRSFFPNNPVDESGVILLTVFLSDGSVTSVNVSYDDMLSEGQSHTSIIKLYYSTYIDTNSMIYNNVDITLDEGIHHPSVPSIELSEDVDFIYSFGQTDLQYSYFEIDSEGEYRITTTTLGNSLNFFLLDLELNMPYDPIDVDISSYFMYENGYTVHLNPGIYYFYMLPMPINTSSGSLSVDFITEVDDFDASLTTDTPVIRESSVFNFSIDYSYDVDSVILRGDYDIAVVSGSSEEILAYSNVFNFRNVDGFGTRILEKGHDDIVLYVSSPTIGDYSLNVMYYSYSNESPTIDDAIEISLETTSMETFKREILTFPQYNGQMLFTFNLPNTRNILASCYGTTITMYDSNMNPIEPVQDVLYRLDAGTYYINISDFVQDYRYLQVASETVGKEMVVLDSNQDSFDIFGFTVGRDDYDLFEITFDNDTAILFDNDKPVSALFYGVDNPNIYIFDQRANHPYKIEAGTYRITMPSDEVTLYAFHFEKHSELDEVEENTYSNVYPDGNVTTYEYNVSFDYTGDLEVLVLDVTEGTKISIEYEEEFFRSRGHFIGDFEEYIQLSDINILETPNGYFEVSSDGRLELTFESYAYFPYDDIFIGETTIKVYVTSEGVE